MSLADRLAGYACSLKYSELDERTLREMKARVIDALGCAVGALQVEPVRMSREVALALRDSGGSTLVGTGKTTSPELATFVNGLMVRYFDFNDTYLSKEPAHPSDNLSTCFALAESEGKTGRDLLAAAVVAYEIQCRFCDAADIRHRGWDHVNYGLASTSLAAARLMELPQKLAGNAVNIAINGHIALRQVRAGELSMWKGASFANAARNGVFAAMLAREGMTGPAPIFEGEMGFFKQVSGPFNLDVEGFGRKGKGFKVAETYVKYWPAEYHAQTAIWAALEVRKKVKEMELVNSVVVETHEAGYTILGKDREKWRPRTKETADHSLPFMVGMALLDGKVDNETYSEKNVNNEKILGFIAKVKVREDPKLTSFYPARGVPNRVTLVLRDGRTVSSEVRVPRGHPLNPMSKDDVEAKFVRLTKSHIGEGDARKALRRLWQLEKEKDIGDVLALLAPD